MSLTTYIWVLLVPPAALNIIARGHMHMCIVHIDRQTEYTSGVMEPQNRSSTLIGLITSPAPANTFTDLCELSKMRVCPPQPSPHPHFHVPLQLPQESSSPKVWLASCAHKAHYLLQQRAGNTTGLEQEKWELIELQQLDGFVKLRTKSGFLLGKTEWSSTFPSLILAPSGKAVMGLEENASLSELSPLSIEIPAGSLEVC